MGGMAESTAGYDAAKAFAGVSTQTGKPLQCANAAMECRGVQAELQSTKSRLEKELRDIEEDRQRLLSLEHVLDYESVTSQAHYEERLTRMQEADIIQRTNIYELEKSLSDARRELADYKNGNTESRALNKLNRIEVLLKQVPHAPMCKVDSGVPCNCHHKAIRYVYDDNSNPSVPTGMTAKTIFNV